MEEWLSAKKKKKMEISNCVQILAEAVSVHVAIKPLRKEWLHFYDLSHHQISLHRSGH